MYFIFKMFIFLFVLHLNLNGLHTKPLDTLSDLSGDGSEDTDRTDDLDISNKNLVNISAGPTLNGVIPETVMFANAKSLLRQSTDDMFSNTVQIDDDDELSFEAEEKDLKSLLVKYDTDDGTSCLLDNIKEEVLWWTFLNGTLKKINLKYSKSKYLDLSHCNLSEDADLLQRSNYFRIRNNRKIEVFSAAFNSLNTVPYRTLSAMDSLTFLSLRGNQFAAADTQVLERLINDTLFESANTTPQKCEHYFESNATDLYDRECLLYQNTNTNTNNTSAAKLGDLTFWDYMSYIQKWSDYLGKSNEGIAWATFPHLPHLLELDISNCSIEYVTKEVFQNITNLRRLFMSNNKMMTIPNDVFLYVQGVQYLDLSFTNVLSYNYQLSMPTLEAVLNLLYGLKIQQTAFKLLPELIYLDLSHSKMTRNSAVAFTHLGEKLKYLSLCFTAFPMASNALFKNTALEGLDLSGNPFVSYNIMDDAFDGIADTLKYLYFDYSNLKDLGWFRALRKLQVLSLAGNNINTLAVDTFQPLASIQILDLTSNHVGNWYKSVFHTNLELRVLNLRDNNINIITTEMLKDFGLLEYISLGDNNFLCDCLLQELVDAAAGNNKQPECSYERLHQANEWLSMKAMERPNLSDITEFQVLHIERAIWQRYVPRLERSYRNIKAYKELNKVFNLRFLSQALRSPAKCSAATPYQLVGELSSESTTLKFQLLDYEEEHYWCFNETEQLQLGNLNCQSRMLKELATELHSLTSTVIVVVGIIVGVSILGFIIYLKRWHIHYYYSSLKSAALLSSASKESIDHLNHLAEQDPNVVYDIFISYCQNDRQWVLDELLPNVEESGDISICLHERDFQIGVTILDNIISCMDRSRSLMLIISSKFMLSHWCQFEMYLAQHRIFEVSKEHLILVFLEDIPRSKRSKTLQYLMDVKTYIKWPAGKGDKKPKLEERRLFWKRLRRSLEFIGISSRNSNS